MNFQTKKIDFEEYEVKACEILNNHQTDHKIYPSDFTYCVWPQVFGSTSGPNGGVGGQAISTFSVIALLHPLGVVMFCGRKTKVVEYKAFQFGMRF